MCRNVMVEHCPRPHPQHRLRRNSIFKLTQNEPSDPKGPENNNLHYDDVPGDVLRPPHSTTLATGKIK